MTAPSDPEPVAAPEAAPEAAPPRPTLDKKRSIIGGIVAIVFLVIVFSRIIPQIGDYEAALESLENMDRLSLALLVGTVLLYLYVYGWPFVAATPGLKYHNGFVVNQSAYTISNGIPGGGAFAMGMQFAQLTSYKATPTAATAAVGATGVWSVFLTLGLPVTGAAALLASGNSLNDLGWLAAVGLLALGLMIIGFYFILRSEGGAQRIGGWGDRFLGGLAHRFRPAATFDFTSATLKLRHDTVGLVTKRWRSITVTNAMVSFGQFSVLAMALRGVSDPGAEINYLAVYGCWAISQIGIMIPLTPGGLGTVDALLISLMISVGIPEGAATAADLLWRASLYVPQILIGLVCIFFWRWQEARRRRREAPAATA